MKYSLYLVVWLTKNLNDKTGCYFQRKTEKQSIEKQDGQISICLWDKQLQDSKTVNLYWIYELTLTLFLERVSFSKVI